MVINDRVELIDVDSVEVEVPVLFPDRVHDAVHVMFNGEAISHHYSTYFILCSHKVNAVRCAGIHGRDFL